LEKIKDKIVIDEKTGIPYNMGFNQEIERLKSADVEGAKSSKIIVEQMNEIMKDLGYFNRQDLIHLHRYILANAISGGFKERAKALVLDAIVKEYYTFSQNKKRSKYIPHTSTVNQALSLDSLMSSELLADAANEEDLLKKVKAKDLNPAVIDKVAVYLAKQEVDRQIDHNSKIDRDQYSLTDNLDSYLVENDDPYFSKSSFEIEKSVQDQDQSDINDLLMHEYFVKKYESLGYDPKNSESFKLDQEGVDFEKIKNQTIFDKNGNFSHVDLLKDMFKLDKLDKEI
jgi:hypothetical protein